MSEGENVTVTVTLTQRDYTSALRALAQSKTTRVGRTLFWISIAVLGYFLYTWLTFFDRPLWSAAGAAVGAAFLLLLLKYGVPILSARSFVKKNPDKLGPAKHSIGPDGMSYENQHGAGTTNWTAYQSIRETTDLFLLYTQSNFAQILPKRCFENANDMERYRQILRNYYKGKLELLS